MYGPRATDGNDPRKGPTSAIRNSTLNFAWRVFNQQVQVQVFWLDQLYSSTLILVTGQHDKWLDAAVAKHHIALIPYQSKIKKN